MSAAGWHIDIDQIYIFRHPSIQHPAYPGMKHPLGCIPVCLPEIIGSLDGKFCLQGYGDGGNAMLMASNAAPSVPLHVSTAPIFSP